MTDPTDSVADLCKALFSRKIGRMSLPHFFPPSFDRIILTVLPSNPANVFSTIRCKTYLSVSITLHECLRVISFRKSYLTSHKCLKNVLNLYSLYY